jgi:hypothetical protein
VFLVFFFTKKVIPDISPGRDRPVGRRAHTAALLRTDIILIGGMIDGSFAQSDETLVMDVSGKVPKWSDAVVQSNSMYVRNDFH